MRFEEAVKVFVRRFGTENVPLELSGDHLAECPQGSAPLRRSVPLFELEELVTNPSFCSFCKSSEAFESIYTTFYQELPLKVALNADELLRSPAIPNYHIELFKVALDVAQLLSRDPTLPGMWCPAPFEGLHRELLEVVNAYDTEGSWPEFRLLLLWETLLERESDFSRILDEVYPLTGFDPGDKLDFMSESFYLLGLSSSVEDFRRRFVKHVAGAISGEAVLVADIVTKKLDEIYQELQSQADEDVIVVLPSGIKAVRNPLMFQVALSFFEPSVQRYLAFKAPRAVGQWLVCKDRFAQMVESEPSDTEAVISTASQLWRESDDGAYLKFEDALAAARAL